MKDINVTSCNDVINEARAYARKTWFMAPTTRWHLMRLLTVVEILVEASEIRQHNLNLLVAEFAPDRLSDAQRESLARYKAQH